MLDIEDRGPLLEAGAFRMRVTNAGVLGNAYFDIGRSFDPSFEFPAHSFAGWDSTDAATTRAGFTNLAPGATYIFAVVAFDEAGAYSPVFTFNTNLLRFRVSVASVVGPRLSVFNEYFRHDYPSGLYSLDPSLEIPLETVVGDRVTVRWSATAGPGARIIGYRWRLGGDVNDETPRTDEATDVARWSFLSPFTTSATLGPFSAGPAQKLYIEARDDLGFRSLGVVRFDLVQADFTKELLIVDDTRLAADQLLSGSCVSNPTGPWPTAAELDTFLYARGGFPWRCYPAGTVSAPGLFAGYAFDTLGAPPGPVPFATLARYRHVVWLVDITSATLTDSRQITSLRYMSQPGRVNTLATYVRLGGKLWLAGGGGGYASTVAYDLSANNTPDRTFSATLGELAPGRFMYDHPRWRSEFKLSRSTLSITRSPSAVGRWSGAPDYSALPAAMQPKSAASDPFPFGRAGQTQSYFYQTQFDLEYLSRGNHIFEDADPDPAIEDNVATLDTLFRAAGLVLPGPATNPQNVCMTYYHGSEGAPVIFSGFNIWSFRRADCAALVDFVLQRIWGLSRRDPVAGPARAGPASAP